jgi:heme transport system substrate-binding protein
MKMIAFLVLPFFIMHDAKADSFQRIISIGGANTEILYALGLADRIVGTDTTSTYPAEARATQKIGYMRALSAEGVLSLKPNLIILTNEAGPPTVLNQLKQVGIEILELTAARSIEDIRNNIIAIAHKLNVESKAQEVLARIDSDMSLLKAALSKRQRMPKIMFILQHGGGAPMVAGHGTAAHSILTLSGAENVAAVYQGYKPLTPEAAIKMQPDFILVTDLGVQQSGGLEAFANIPGLNLTQAAQNKRIIVMDQQFLLGFGPRTAEAALKLHQYYTDIQS